MSDEKKEKPAAAKGDKKSGKKKKASLTKVTLLWLGLFVAAALYLHTTVLVIFGMLPAYVSWAVDRRREKYVATTVTIMNFCGVLPYVIELWRDGPTVEIAVRILSQPETWFVMFGAAGIGWLLTMTLPSVMSLTTNMQREERVRRLKKRQERLLAEWGDQIVQRRVDAEDGND